MDYDFNDIYELNHDGTIDGDKSGKLFFKKGRYGCFPLAVSNVKLSELARKIDPKLAVANLFAYDTELFPNPRETQKLIPIASERFFDPAQNENKFGEVQWSSAVKPEWFTKYDDMTDTQAYANYFPNTDLGVFFSRENVNDLQYIADFGDKTIKRDMIKQFLLNSALGTIDMYDFRNFSIIRDRNHDAHVAPAYDMEMGMFMMTEEVIHEAEHCTRRKADPRIYGAYGILQRGLSPENVKYIKSQKCTKLIGDQFFESLTHVREKELDKTLDFTKLKFVAEYFNQTKWDLGKMTERAVNGYKNRFAMLADQYTRI